MESVMYVVAGVLIVLIFTAAIIFSLMNDIDKVRKDADRKIWK